MPHCVYHYPGGVHIEKPTPRLPDVYVPHPRAVCRRVLPELRLRVACTPTRAACTGRYTRKRCYIVAKDVEQAVRCNARV